MGAQRCTENIATFVYEVGQNNDKDKDSIRPKPRSLALTSGGY